MKRILRITYFKWGDSINNWYTPEQLNEQLKWERDSKREQSSDITRVEWYECTQIDKPAIY
jgi:hypothetical protein